MQACVQLHTHIHSFKKKMSETWNTRELVAEIATTAIRKYHQHCLLYRIDTIESFNRLRTCMVRVQRNAQLICCSIVPDKCCVSNNNCCSVRQASKSINNQLENLPHKNFSLCYYYSESYIQTSTGKRCAFASLILVDSSSPT